MCCHNPTPITATSSPVFGMDWRAGVLEMGPGMWLHSLSRDQALDAALQLHRDVCLMTTNLDVLDHVLCLQGTASNILELGLGPRGFPSEEVAAGAMGPQVCRASAQMEAMGLWWPSLDPVLIPWGLYKCMTLYRTNCCGRILVCRSAGHSDISYLWVRPLLAGLWWVFVYSSILFRVLLRFCLLEWGNSVIFS